MCIFKLLKRRVFAKIMVFFFVLFCFFVFVLFFFPENFIVNTF